MELLLTLGHNSSAILMNNKDIVGGYEEERFTRDKKTSSFPINSIRELFKLKEPNPDEENILYVSHWFDDFDFYKKYNEIISKYWDYDFVQDVLVDIYNFKIKTLNFDFTHHDAHAYSSLAFYDNFKDVSEFDGHIIVADGFGNKEEVFSIYKVDNNKNVKLLNRAYGYGNSLGLMYQYATSFCGMKEKQDEYKFLGYEAEIKRLNSLPNFLEIEKIVNNFVDVYSTKKTSISDNSDFINLNTLEMTRNYWYSIFNKILRDVGYDENVDDEFFTKRVIIGYFIQKIIELVNIKLIEIYNIKNVLLSGGIYYNVKLNMSISRNVDLISVIPVTGDQGVAIGMYYKDKGDFYFDNLCYGKRKLDNVEPTKHFLRGVEYFTDKNKLIQRAAELLNEDEIVQVVFGDMEFGPRALCHTSTLAKPTKKNANFINKSNNRNEIMPMAPVVLGKNAEKLFYKEQLKKIVGSDEYMIITLDYKENVPYEKYSGVMHRYPGYAELYSGRPQIVRDEKSTIYGILKNVNDLALINTSYNIHGKPIVRSLDDAIDDFKYQIEHTNNRNRLHLLIGLYNEW